LGSGLIPDAAPLASRVPDIPACDFTNDCNGFLNQTFRRNPSTVFHLSQVKHLKHFYTVSSCASLR
jgi:hypothetical protein